MKMKNNNIENIISLLRFKLCVYNFIQNSFKSKKHFLYIILIKKNFLNFGPSSVW